MTKREEKITITLFIIGFIAAILGNIGLPIFLAILLGCDYIGDAIKEKKRL